MVNGISTTPETRRLLLSTWGNKYNVTERWRESTTCTGAKKLWTRGKQKYTWQPPKGASTESISVFVLIYTKSSLDATSWNTMTGCWLFTKLFKARAHFLTPENKTRGKPLVAYTSGYWQKLTRISYLLRKRSIKIVFSVKKETDHWVTVTIPVKYVSFAQLYSRNMQK